MRYALTFTTLLATTLSMAVPRPWIPTGARYHHLTKHPSYRLSEPHVARDEMTSPTPKAIEVEERDGEKTDER